MSGLCKDCKWWQKVDSMGWCKRVKDAPVEGATEDEARLVIHTSSTFGKHLLPFGATREIADLMTQEVALYTGPNWGCESFSSCSEDIQGKEG